MTTTIKTSPTTAAYERLTKLSTPPDFGHQSEVPVWLAAAAGSFELPPEVLAVVDRGLHLAELYAANVRPAAHRDTDPEALLSGARIEHILDADDDHARAEARYHRGETLLLAAGGHLEGEARDCFAPIRDNLIRNELREAVAQVLAEARKAADALRRFAPDYPPRLLSEGNADELQVWRDSRELQRRLDLYHAAWMASWRWAVFARGDVDLRPQRPGGYFAWTDPDAIKSHDLRVGIDREVLRIAAQPSEYRLLAPSELMPLHDRMEADLGPHPAHNAVHLIRKGVCE